MASAPPTALVLIAASYDADALTITLVFNLAVDIDFINGEAIVVDDGEVTGLQYTATEGATLIDPKTVVIGLDEVGPASGGQVILNASDKNQIFSVDPQFSWAGVSDVELPWP